MYQPTCANEFPNDNPALHQGARWICRGPLGEPRALLQAPPGPPLPSQLEPSEALLAPAAEPAQPVAAPPPVSSASLELAPVSDVPVSVAPVSVAPERSSVELAARLAGPLHLDLARIVLPHRVADIPPPPEFVFRPFVSSQRRSAEAAAAPLPLLGYRVVDARAGAHRVERRWRVDIAPCLGVGVERRVAKPVEPWLPGLAPEVRVAESTAAELEALAQVLFPDLPVPVELALLAPVEPPSGEPPIPELSDLVAQQLPAASEVQPSKKKQRRRAARVASSASLVAAALPGNAELSRTLAEIESEFAERRTKPARNRRQRRAAPAAATSEAPPRRAANAV